MSWLNEKEEEFSSCKYFKTNNCKKLFTKYKANKVTRKHKAPFQTLMSCFDRDHRVVVQRGNNSSTTQKNEHPPSVVSSTLSQSKTLGNKPGPAAPSTTSRTSKTVYSNSSLKLKNLKERLKDDDELSLQQKQDLEIEYADCLCDLGRFREAATIYARIFGGQKSQLPFERLRHFVKTLTKVTVDSVANAGVSLSKFTSSQTDGSKKDQNLLYLPGHTCPDPLSCPVCAGVICDPITLPCGHSYCRKCIVKSSGLKSACLKCGASWKPSEYVDQVPAGTDPISVLKHNVMMIKLVQRYWSEDLKAMELKSKANAMHQQGKYEKAVDFFTQALQLAPLDHLLWSNRSLSYFHLGKYELSLSDAKKATEVKPDWAKGYFRKAAALQALGRHEEAFQSFYECLTLEEDKSAKLVKAELTRELHTILISARKRRQNSENEDSPSSSPTPKSDKKAFDFDTDETVVIPLSMVALVEYASSVSPMSTNHQLPSSLPNWMTRAVTPFRIQSRPISPNAIIDCSDYECPLCMQLLTSPVSTPCGHTFCRRCLDRALDHNAVCPLCKSSTLTSYLAERRDATTEFIEECMKKVIPNEYHERQRAVQAELRELAGLPPAPVEQCGTLVSSMEDAQSCPEIPIFVCTMSFPSVRCPLHIFEPRYRLMVRRTMEIGTRQFGMCCKVKSCEPFSEYGTMLEIRDIHVFRDGRSVIDTRGRRRFKVLERRVRDGYNVASVEFLKDDLVAEDQIKELVELHDETLDKTKEWFSSLDDEMKRRFENHYGDMPPVESDFWHLQNGPAWHWWTIAILPLDPPAQVQVLSQTSLKKRLETIQRIIRYLQSRSF